MSARTRLAGFVAILAVAFAGAFGIGRAVGPIGGTSVTNSVPADHGHG